MIKTFFLCPSSYHSNLNLFQHIHQLLVSKYLILVSKWILQDFNDYQVFILNLKKDRGPFLTRILTYVLLACYPIQLETKNVNAHMGVHFWCHGVHIFMVPFPWAPIMSNKIFILSIGIWFQNLKNYYEGTYVIIL